MELLTKLESLNNIRKCIKDLQVQEEQLAKPLRTDYTTIGNIFDIYVACLKENNPKANCKCANERYKFLFVVLAIYCPRALVGGKITKGGLRRKIAEVTQCEVSVVSHNIELLLFRYQKYRTFRREVDDIYCKVMAVLERNYHQNSLSG